LALSQAELEAGISYWLTRRTFPNDFHNSFYGEMAAINPNGEFDDVWWSRFLPHLVRWKAIRPKPRAFVTGRARSRFDELGANWSPGWRANSAMDVANAPWHEIEAFAGVVAEIKDVASPVFTSQFCHFLLPQVFPVVDNEVMGNRFRTYRDYYEFAQDEWTATPPGAQEDLDACLRGTVPAMIPAYPVRTKIIELCVIGRRCANQ
jgi:hypothetical protein